MGPPAFGNLRMIPLFFWQIQTEGSAQIISLRRRFEEQERFHGFNLTISEIGGMTI
jgi:hypothetical protein